MLAQQRPAGVPDGVSPDELERWSNELVAFLTSDGIPASFRGWARKHADLLDAYMASAEDFESDLCAGESDLDVDEEEQDEAPAGAPRALSALPKQKSPRAAKAGRRAATAEEPRMLVLRMPEQVGKLGIGIAVGVLALFAIFGVRALTSADGKGGPLPATAGAAAFDQARADELQALLEQNPSDQDALFEIGEMNFQANRNEEAISWFTKLVELDPANIHAMTDMGTANFNLGQPDKAKEWWQKVLTIDPNDVQAHYNMGFVFANTEPRDLAGAVSEWETVVRLDPTSQLGQTAKVHVDGLKAQITGTPDAAGAAATPTAAVAP
jgi:Flp pilus assembly protein TadD